MVAKPGSELPPLDVPVWAEPERPAHPLTGLVAALERAAPRAVVALACDMPFVPPALIAELAALDAVAAAPPGEAFPARYAPAALPALRAGLAREAAVRDVLAELDPVAGRAPTRGRCSGSTTRRRSGGRRRACADRLGERAGVGRIAARERRQPARDGRGAALRAVRGDRRELEHRGDLRGVGHGLPERLGELGDPFLGGRHRADVSLPPVSKAPDVAIVGGGIVGCALAAYLAEDGASVRLYERDVLAAGASGRNSGLLQHPMDEVLTGIFARSEALYAELGHGFELPRAGRRARGRRGRRGARAHRAPTSPRASPSCAPRRVDPHEAEPALAEGLAGYRLDTGRPVPPAAATHAFAARARAAGAELARGHSGHAVADGRDRRAHRRRRRARRRRRRRRRPVDLRARRPHRRVAARRARCGASTSSCGSPSRRATRSRRAASRTC